MPNLKGRLRRWKGLWYLYQQKREENKDSRIFAWEGLLAAMVLNLGTAFTSMYGTRLGANSTEIGLLASLPQLLAMFFLIPGTLLAGRSRHTRRFVEIYALLTGIFYGLAFLAPVVKSIAILLLILASSMGNAFLNLYNSTWQSYFSNTIELDKRNRYYSERTTVTFVAATLVLLLSGLVLGSTQDPEKRLLLYQLCYLLTLVLGVIQYFVIRRMPTAEVSPSGTRVKDLVEAAKKLFGDKNFRRFYAIIILFHAGWYYGWTLFFLNEVHYVGADESWIGYIFVTQNIVQILTMRYWTRVSEHKGPEKALIAGMIGLVTNPFLSAVASYLPEGLKLPGLLLLNLIMAASFGGWQLALLQCTLKEMPKENSRINLALFNSSVLAANAITQMLSVSVYEALGSDHRAMTISLSISGGLRLIATILYIIHVKQQSKLAKNAA